MPFSRCSTPRIILAALALKGELPVVDDAGAVRGQVRDPPFFRKADQDRAQPVLDRVRAEGEHDRTVGGARPPDPLGRLAQRCPGPRCERGRFGVGGDVVSFDVQLAPPLGSSITW